MMEEQDNPNQELSKKQYLRLYGWVNLYSLLSLIVGSFLNVIVFFLVPFIVSLYMEVVGSFRWDELFILPGIFAMSVIFSILISMPVLLVLHGIYTLPIIRLFEKKRPRNVMLYWLFFSYFPIVLLSLFLASSGAELDLVFVYGLICPFIVGYYTKRKVLSYLDEKTAVSS